MESIVNNLDSKQDVEDNENSKLSQEMQRHLEEQLEKEENLKMLDQLKEKEYVKSEDGANYTIEDIQNMRANKDFSTFDELEQEIEEEERKQRLADESLKKNQDLEAEKEQIELNAIETFSELDKQVDGESEWMSQDDIAEYNGVNADTIDINNPTHQDMQIEYQDNLVKGKIDSEDGVEKPSEWDLTEKQQLGLEQLNELSRDLNEPTISNLDSMGGENFDWELTDEEISDLESNIDNVSDFESFKQDKRQIDMFDLQQESQEESQVTMDMSGVKKEEPATVNATPKASNPSYSEPNQDVINASELKGPDYDKEYEESVKGKEGANHSNFTAGDGYGFDEPDSGPEM